MPGSSSNECDALGDLFVGVFRDFPTDLGDPVAPFSLLNNGLAVRTNVILFLNPALPSTLIGLKSVDRIFTYDCDYAYVYVNVLDILS